MTQFYSQYDDCSADLSGVYMSSDQDEHHLVICDTTVLLDPFITPEGRIGSFCYKFAKGELHNLIGAPPPGAKPKAGAFATFQLRSDTRGTLPYGLIQPADGVGFFNARAVLDIQNEIIWFRPIKRGEDIGYEPLEFYDVDHSCLPDEHLYFCKTGVLAFAWTGGPAPQTLPEPASPMEETDITSPAEEVEIASHVEEMEITPNS